MRRLLSVFVVFVIGAMLTMSLSMSEKKARADEIETDVIIDEEEPYVLVRSASCYVSISSGTATVSSDISGKNGVYSTSLTVYLEKYVSGSWQPYMSWSHSGGRILTQQAYHPVHTGYGCLLVRQVPVAVNRLM